MIVLKGNDVTLEWTIFKCLDGSEIPEDFGEADLKVSLVYRGKQMPTKYLVLGNLISVTIPGDKQPLGIVGIEAIWSKNDPPKWSRMFESNAVEFTNIPERAIESCQIGEGENVVIKARSILYGSVGYDGITPRIGLNGNWFIGQTDTGYSSKGDAFLFEDFTPQQIEVLQRPAKDAADSVGKLESTVSSNEQIRIDSESIRGMAEQDRVQAESSRVIDTAIAIKECDVSAKNANLKAVYAEEQGNYAKGVGDSLPEFIPLTQAEYNALPDSKLTDGNYYTII